MKYFHINSISLSLALISKIITIKISLFFLSKDSHASSALLKDDKPIDPNAIPTGEFDEHYGNYAEHHHLLKKNRKLKWISLSLLSITILSIILVSANIWITCRRQSKDGFVRVPATATNV